MTTEITLSGLRGDNPLAFLATLGMLRVLSIAVEREDSPRISWKVNSGSWRPMLRLTGGHTPESLTSLVVTALQQHCSTEPFGFAKNTSTDPEVFASFVDSACDRAFNGDRRLTDFAASFGCEVLVDAQGKIQDTELRTMSGAGHQHFLKFMDDLCAKTEEHHIYEALFGPWRYKDAPPSMRWDPVDDRRYALRWKNPSQETIRTVRGANRLAIEALPFFTTAPLGCAVRTVGFRGRKWTWPIWSSPCDVDIVRSLLTLQELQEPTPDRGRLGAVGIAEIYRSTRLTVGKYRNFSPAETA